MPLWSKTSLYTNASHALTLAGRIKYSAHCPIVSASVKPIYFFYFSAGENNRVCHLDFGRQRRCPLHVVSLLGLALCADSGCAIVVQSLIRFAAIVNSPVSSWEIELTNKTNSYVLFAAYWVRLSLTSGSIT